MGTRRNTLAAVVIVACILAATVLYLRVMGPSVGAPARVAPADNRDYFPLVHELLTAAEHSVDVILYQSRFYFHYPGSWSNTLISDLADASDRGVRVRVVIEQADWNVDNSEGNRDVWNVLTGGKIEILYDPVERTSHSKLLIIDDRYVVIGSTNWSHYSLDVNAEANVVIDSEKVARAFRRYFDRTVESSGGPYVPAYEVISAAQIDHWGERYALLKDVVDSSVYDPARNEGRIFFGDLVVTAVEGAVDEVLAVDSTFFAGMEGESLRVVARLEMEEDLVLSALDLERSNTVEAMVSAFEAERSDLRKAHFPKVEPAWMDAARVVAVPNEKYAAEVRKLISRAKRRIWIAILDARYYESTPATARRQRQPGDVASVSNLLLSDLIGAAAGGVDVRFVCDAGWSGRMPQSKTDFLERLNAGGGTVYIDSPDITTHAKVAIIDDDFTVVGSTNWSYHALEENNETAVIIESPEVNAHYAEFIESAIEGGAPFEPGG